MKYLIILNTVVMLILFYVVIWNIDDHIGELEDRLSNNCLLANMD